jgi:hypothetical protein
MFTIDSGTQPKSLPQGLNKLVTYQLMLGLNIPQGGTVTDAQWEFFIKHMVAPEFDNFTVQDAVGYWKGEREPTKLLTICTSQRLKVLRIADRYKAIFSQEAVAIQEFPPIVLR